MQSGIPEVRFPNRFFEAKLSREGAFLMARKKRMAITEHWDDSRYPALHNLNNVSENGNTTRKKNLYEQKQN